MTSIYSDMVDQGWKFYQQSSERSAEAIKGLKPLVEDFTGTCDKIATLQSQLKPETGGAPSQSTLEAGQLINKMQNTISLIGNYMEKLAASDRSRVNRMATLDQDAGLAAAAAMQKADGDFENVLYNTVEMVTLQVSAQLMGDAKPTGD